jgi:hypothetical protein
MPELIAIGCNLAAGLIVLAAFVVYNLKDAKINTGTWIILAFGDFLDLASYFEMTEDWWKSIVPASFAVGSILTFGIGYMRKRFSWPDRFDWCVIFIDLLIIGVWTWYEANTATMDLGSHELAPPAVANLALQATAIVAFIPMYRALLSGKEREQSLPWILWTIAFVLFSTSSLFNLDTIEEVVYPIVGLLTHGLVIVLVRRANQPLRI